MDDKDLFMELDEESETLRGAANDFSNVFMKRHDEPTGAVRAHVVCGE